jgi:electron-transferring-flavoprotein dehydrogenase
MSDRQTMDVDIVCVGFGPATGGFLTTLARARDLPPSILCYERADDIGFGVSGVVTRARGIRASFPELNAAEIPMAAEIGEEKVLYLLDPIGASRRSLALRAADKLIRAFRFALPVQDDALELAYTPEFLHKQGGLVLSIGQFNQWVGQQLMASGTVQIWPATPVAEALIEGDRVAGVRLADQGTDRQGNPEPGYMPGMDVRAALTVVGDGPFGAVGRQINQRFGMPEGNTQREWAIGMKMVIDLAGNCELEAGTVLHTFGYPEPEIFGFLYVHPERVASVGIFVPSWMDSPVRTAYRYLQHYIQHPRLWRHLKGGTLRSWGAKSLQESGRHGEPHLAGHGYARIGEGSGSTNVLTGSGVDEAWTTGTQLGEAVLELLREGKPYTKENLEATYVRRRRASWIEREGRVAERARDGFHHGVVTGLVGMGLAGLTGGKLWAPGEHLPHYQRIPSVVEYYKSRIPAPEIARIREECAAKSLSIHDALMERAGWPAIEHDGKLLVSQQDALLMGGKVQAPAGYADHVVFLYPSLCESCETQICVEICSGQAIAPGPGPVPVFDREKCIHCGACLWNCSQPLAEDPERTNIDFRAGAGGLHSSEN